MIFHLVRINNKKDFLEKVEEKLKKRVQTTYFYANAGSFFYLKANDFLKALNSATNIYLNSNYLGFLIKLLSGKKIQKLNAEDFLYDLLLVCERLNKRIFLLGSDNIGVQNAVKNIKLKYKNLAISGHHGYFSSDKDVFKTINKFKPDLILVGLGLGNQELWVFKNSEQFKKSVVITVGNFIDILGRRKKLPPSIFKKLNLEWLYRLCKEPSRLWKRYLLGAGVMAVSFLFAIINRSNERTSK